VTPEQALKQAEQFTLENNPEKAIESLNSALQNRRNKGNNQMLERLMVSAKSCLTLRFRSP
jgi:thioredoxin-like negative regulator of GroEL